MSDPLKVLLAFGLLFPVISLFSGMLSWWGWWRYRKPSSSVFVPFVGPILLSWWVWLMGLSAWLIPVAWLFDVGTLAFLYVAPRIFREWWRISWFTKRLTLRGRKGIEAATLELHFGGHYWLRKAWNRPSGQFGITALGETGTFTEAGEGYELMARHGLRRGLRPLDDQSAEPAFLVSEETVRNDDWNEDSLDGWILKERRGES